MSEHGIDVLAVGAHPDDVELNVGGTLLLASDRGLQTAAVHVTAGEMGTRGTPERRRGEAEAAAAELGVATMEMLGLPDGLVTVDDASKDAMIRALRRHRPRVVLAPYWDDLHPDHAAVGALVRQTAFLAGLEKWDTDQEPWRPHRVMYYMSHTPFTATVIADVTGVIERKKAAAACYASQFHAPASDERETFISRPDFWHYWYGRAAWWGHFIGVKYGEGFFLDSPIETRDPVALFDGFGKYRDS